MSSDSKTKHGFGKKRFYAVITIIIIAVAAIAAWQIYPIVHKSSSSPSSSVYANLLPMNLTLVGANGTQKVLHASDIARLTAFTGLGGLETSVGTIEDIGNYTGVQLITLCDLVGGIGANDSVQITGSDGYSMVFSYNQTNGNGFVTYDPVTGKEVSNEGSLTLVLAYHDNGANLTSDGPLKLAILGKGGLLTDGHYWVKWIVKIQILPAIVDWTLVLKDVSEVNSTRIFEYNITRSYFEASEAPNCHAANWTDSSRNVWTGIPLWLLAASVEDWNFSMSFNASLAASNAYEVVVISQSGGNRTFTSSFVANSGSGMIVANELNGAVLPAQYWPLRLVGSAVASDDMVVNIVEIELVFLGS
jgi:hypothetical protein